MTRAKRTAAIKIAWAIALILPTAFAGSAAQAQDSFKVAIGQLEIWSGQAPILGQKAGIFKKHGIVLENFGTLTIPVAFTMFRTSAPGAVQLPRSPWRVGVR